MCVPPSSTTSSTLHHMLLLLYLNVVLKVNDVVLGYCLSCSVRSALLRSQRYRHDNVTTSWSLSGHSTSVTVSRLLPFVNFSVNHNTPVMWSSFLPAPPRPLWTNCQYKEDYQNDFSLF